MILAIDPGLRWCGCALGDETGLKHAGLSVSDEKTLRGPLAWRRMTHSVVKWVQSKTSFGNIGELIVEVPRIYPHSDQRKGDLNDLIELAGVVGSIVGGYCGTPINFYYPAQWKGNVPKKIMTERIRKKLRSDELAVFESVGARDHNTLDAVGIYLHAMRRL